MSATASSTPAPLSLRDVLKISGFKRLWLAQLVSILGDFLAVFGVINLITFKWHGTPLQVTNVMIAFIIPMATVGPLAGVFVDRWNVKRTMIISDLVRAVLILGLAFVTRLEQIYVIFFLVSTVSSFFSPSQSVSVRDPGAAERTDVCQRAHVSGFLHHAHHCARGGRSACVRAWIQLVLLSGYGEFCLFSSNAQIGRAHV